MALSTSGPLVGAISGRLGPITFIYNRAGQILRTSQRHQSVTSPKQYRQAAKMQTARLRWQTLSASLQLQWDTAAQQFISRDRLGRRHRLSAFQLYCKVNGCSPLFDATFYDTPPVNFHIYPATVDGLTFRASTTYNLNLIWAPSDPLFHTNVWIARPHSTNRRKSFTHWIACGIPTFIPLPTHWEATDLNKTAVSPLIQSEYARIRVAPRAT